MAINDFGGAVLGRQVELIFADHRNSTDLGTNIARQWYGEGVDAIVDVPNSGVALAVQQVSREMKKIVLFSSPASADLTGLQCSPYSVQWTYDTYAMAHGTAKAIAKSGGDSWFFITPNYAAGLAFQRDTTRFVEANGGKLWIWLDPHGGLGGPALIYLNAATERPGSTRATSRIRSALRPHRFRTYERDGYKMLFDTGAFDPPEELHLVVKRFPKRHVEAFWNGAIFVDDEIRH